MVLTLHVHFSRILKDSLTVVQSIMIVIKKHNESAQLFPTSSMSKFRSANEFVGGLFHDPCTTTRHETTRPFIKFCNK